MDNYIWIGKCESDIENSRHLFFYSITIYGSNQNNNYSFFECKDIFDYDIFMNFIIDKVRFILKRCKNIKLYFYNQQWALNIIQKKPDFKSLIINLNNAEIVNLLNNKSMCRQWISTISAIPPFILINGLNASMNYIKEFFPGYNSFIIQENISEGGEGTYLLNNSNERDVQDILEPTGFYLASPYFESSISLNATIMIKEEKHIIFPISEQFIKIDGNAQNFLFNGSDFISGHCYQTQFHDQIYSFLEDIINALIKEKYTGILGVDFIIHNDKLYFVEINPRLQGSSFIIDKLLYENIGMSLHELNVLSPEDITEKLINSINDIVPSYSFSYNKKINNITPIRQIIDGNTTTLNRYIYNTTISSSNYDYTSNDYYNFFAQYYHLILPDWEESIQSEGIILKRIIEKHSKINVKSVLDCTCGIGIQTISLAMQGVNICGSDISAEELNIAKRETEKRNLNIDYYLADCRELSKTFSNRFDAIISIDSAMPHLLTAENFTKAFSSIYEQLNLGGVFLASFRDYDSMIKVKPQWAYEPRLRKIGKKTIIILRHFEWENDICTSHQYYIENTSGRINILYNTYKQWAITRDNVLKLARTLPFSESFWLLPKETNFYQPILCLIK